MKTRFQSWWSLTALAAMLSMGIALNAQQTQPQQPPSAQTPAPPTSDQPAPPPANSGADQAAPSNGQVFSGTIVKVGDRYMLRDEAGAQTYDLDHQDQVQKFAGKRVRVHGTLDPNGKMIHLQ
jgi:uncharacterized protein YdeI (BOF family)